MDDLPAYSQRARAEQAGYTSTGRKRIVTTNPGVRIRPRGTAEQTKPRYSFEGAGIGVWGRAVIVGIVVVCGALARLASSTFSSGRESGNSNAPSSIQFQPNAPATWANPQTSQTPQQRIQNNYMAPLQSYGNPAARSSPSFGGSSSVGGGRH